MVSIKGYLVASKAALTNLFKKPATIMFPNDHVPLPARYRGAPHLTPEKCTLCKKCVRICPTKALAIEKTDDPSRFTFIIDIGRCCYCQECEHVCPFDAIHLSDEWLTAELQREPLIRRHTVIKEKKKKVKN